MNLQNTDLSNDELTEEEYSISEKAKEETLSEDAVSREEVDPEVSKKMTEQIVTPHEGGAQVNLNETQAAALSEAKVEADIAAKKE